MGNAGDELEVESKESIDRRSFKKMSQEEQHISRENISKIEEPLVYKTMNNCLDAHFHFLHNHLSVYMTPHSFSHLNASNQ